ncbi:CPBP family intramembrane glutamic endopeptidase [Microbacterium hibisci]|uniref:CPBP family intramembrane glutamic endopeptidase n=1 Tax=Microbacterium hibisci TaxID=2036000 RepID=UPI001941F35B|nr:CPBP family intramembrane glutamic endopeptidase [Microbacterium hibisci]
MTMQTSSAPPSGRERRVDRHALAWGLGLPAGRVLLVAVACSLAWVALVAGAGWSPYPGPPLVTAVAMLPVNVVCLAVVVRRIRATGRRVRDMIGYRRGRLGRDILWGLLWLLVLYVPFAVTIMLVMWALHGAAMFTAFETVFFDPESVPDLSPAVAAVLAIVAVLTFAPLNAPTEELLYRGAAQEDLSSRMPVPAAILISAAFFGLQHIWYAPTSAAVVVYACAFFVWGVGSGVIAWRQGRLLPLIIAHGLVNLLTTLPALLVPFLLANGLS